MSADNRDLSLPPDQSGQLEQLAKLAGELAHEIKNPLSTVKINLKLTAEELDSVANETDPDNSRRVLSRAQRKIGVIQQETERLEKILDGFLRYVGRTELNATYAPNTTT